MARNSHPKVKPGRPKHGEVAHVKLNPLLARYLNKRHIPLRKVEVVDENTVMIYNKSVEK